jgi:hypothetical protein
MSRPRIGQQLLMAIALGLIVLPAVSWATTVTIQHPFDSYTSNPASLSVVNSISINNDGAANPNTVYFGTLDLKNNDLVIHPSVQDVAHAYSTFHAVYDMLRSGVDQGAYDQTGISSSTVNLDATLGNGALAIGVMLNDDGGAVNPDGSGNPIWGGVNSDLGSWDGYTNLSQYDTLVKYSFIGDLFLEGKVTQTDAAVVFGNLGTQPDNNTPFTQRWQNGDFFYQVATGGQINQTDYAVAFGNLSAQANYPYTITFGSASALSVPEPASILTAALGILGSVLFLARRRRGAAS